MTEHRIPMPHLLRDGPIVFVAGPALGHVGRMAVIARRLRIRTDRPIVFVTPGNARYADSVLNDAFHLVRIPIPDESHKRPAEAFADGLEAVLTELKPRVLVCDLCPLRWLSAVRFPDCPRVMITNFFLAGLLPVETHQSRWLRDEDEYFTALRKRRSLQPFGSLRDLYSAEKVLLADPPPLLEALGSLPSGYVPTGHCSFHTGGTLPEPLERMSDLLLLSMGSTGALTMDGALTKRIAAWSQSSSIVYAGSRADEMRAAGVAEECYDWLPLDPVLERTRVTVTHGGAGSTYMALSHGVPVVVNPTLRNHRVLGECIEAAGIGLCIGAPSHLKKFDTVGFAGILERTRRFSEQASGLDGADIGAREIEDLA
ncbi:glycosyltransferase [Aquibium pacificus]